MKLHLLPKLFSVIAFIYLASSGQCQEKDKETPLTASQKKEEVLKADLIYKEMIECRNNDDFVAAMPLAIQALKIYKKILGDKHPKTINSLNNLGLLYRDQSQYAKAEPYLVEALKIRREALGNKHPDTALSLNNLARNYYDQAQYAKAEPFYLESLKIWRETLDDKHPNIAQSLNNLGLLYRDQAQFTKAEPYLLEALKIRREALGNKHPNTALSLNNLGLLYSDQNQYAKAEPLYLELLKICRETLGNKHPNTALSLNYLARNYYAQGQDAKAEPLYLESLKIWREALGNKHPNIAQSLNNLGLLYRDQAQFTKAEPYLLEALKIRREALGNKHPNTALSLNNLGLLYSDQNQYAKAEPLYLESLKIRREALGNKHPDTAYTLFNVSKIYFLQAQYAKAEPLILESLKIRREALGNKHPDTASTLLQLANLYSAQGQYAKAELLDLEALKIRREIHGDKHPETIQVLNNLSTLYAVQGQFAKAQPLLIENLKIQREIYGDKNPAVAQSLNTLGFCYSHQGQYTKAESLYLEALKIWREPKEYKEPGTALSLTNLAWLYSKQAQYAKAEPLLIEALKIDREIHGDKHPDTALRLYNLARNFSEQAQYAKAEPLLVEALKITTNCLNVSSTIQGENAQILMTKGFKFYLNGSLDNALGNHTPGGGYDHVLSWKGMIYRRQNLLRALQGNDPLKKELSDTIRQLATLLNSTPKPGEDQAFQDKVKALSDKKEELEKELAKLIPSLNLAKITPSDLQNLIAPDTALIDIFNYGGPYTAWVIRKDKPIVRVELGSAEDIDNLVFQWRSSLSTRKSPSEGPQDPASALRGKVWLPIAKHLEGAKTVIISPDGMLGTLPFTALPGEDIKKYLIEERNIAVVPFLQTLPDLLAKKESTGIASLLALGDVAYDVEATSQSNTSGLLAVRGKKGAKWNRLPGTKTEILSIENSFRKYFPSGSLVELNQNKASEQSVRESAPKSRYLHFATHGFFADESIKVEDFDQDGDKKMMVGEAATGENPGLLSGLVLAGVNLPPKGNGDDGILTASEVAELDLTGVELAILSACETGLGKTAGGEGIFGLQRAFQLAGARTVVASSWKVPDLSTKELMVRFYGNLWEKKMGKLEALREAQLWVMKEGKAAGLDRGIDDESVVVKDTKKEPVKVEGSTKGEMLPPKYWAAWILSGAWN